MTYEFVYDGQSRPRWEKVLTASSGEEFRVPLVFENSEDRLTLTADQVYTHINNFVQYMKDKTSGISAIGLQDPLPDDGWHFNGGWAEVEWAKDEVLKWWDWAYYNDAFDTEEPTDPEEPA